MTEKYQDYVIKDGKFVGKFEEMYQKFEDPWGQSSKDTFDTAKAVVKNWCQRLRHENGASIVLEIGCGFGDMVAEIAASGLKCYGTDISLTAVKKARLRNTEVNFEVNDFMATRLYQEIDPDIFIMSELSWYVLPQLEDFIAHLKAYHNSKYLVHILIVYEKSVQKYGREYFDNLESILNFFALDYLEYGEVKYSEGGGRTFFLAKI